LEEIWNPVCEEFVLLSKKLWSWI